MLANLLFGDRVAVELENVASTEAGVELTARAVSASATCPECEVPSGRIHSRYLRSLCDVALAALPVRICLRVRRFFCENQECSRKIFAEPLDGLALPYQRHTERMVSAQRQIALALGGEAGARLAQSLGMPSSGDTLLRRLRQLASCPHGALRVIGVDDWALRRGQTYGTLICDLERRRPVALLATRSTEALAEWLKSHPEIEIISRDRAGDYARAANLGAPQAVQVADRWHLLRNVQEALKKSIEPQQPDINNALNCARMDENALDQTTAVNCVDHSSPIDCSDTVDCSKVVGLSEQSSTPDPVRLQRFETVNQLEQQGHSQREIARITGLSRNTVRRFLHSREFPTRARNRRPGRITPFASAIDELMHQGTTSATEILRRLKERGFSGSYHMVVRYVRNAKVVNTQFSAIRSSIRTALWSVRRTAWLLVREGAELSEAEQKYATIIESACPEVRVAAEIARGFATMVRNRDASALDGWIARATSSEAPNTMRQFARNLIKDLSAVKASLTLPWSNGQLEGQINRLKTIKRQMYGRANLKLLECRLLNSA